MSAQPGQKPWGSVQDTDVLELLIDNIHCLEYRIGSQTRLLKIPYFDHRFVPNPAAVQETKRHFCIALTQLLEKHDKLKKRPGRPRKTEE
jgi:hypothetical protein